MKLESYRDFWPHYLREHAQPANRALHYLGTTGVFAIALSAGLQGEPRILIALPLCGYFFAWLGHFALEKNKPATFTYPAWSLVSDFRMYALWISGRLGPHLKAAGVGR